MSKLILGTVQFGVDYGVNFVNRPSIDMVKSILDVAERAGVTILDTSAAYGVSESVLGKCLTEFQDKFKIVSKYPKNQNSVLDTFNMSLKNIGVNNLYGYLLHHFEVYRDNPEIWSEFEMLKTNGLVEKIGFSLYSPLELEIILERGDKFDLIQFPYNIFDRQFEPYFPKLKELGVEIHVRSTFLQGLFFRDRDNLPKKLTPMRKYLLELDQYANDKSLSIEEIALNFNIQNQYTDGVLIGVDNVSQLNANINSVIYNKIEVEIDVVEKELLNPVNWK